MPALGSAAGLASKTFSARLGLLNAPDSSQDFLFHFAVNRGDVTRLAPKSTRRTYSANYVDVPIALSDHMPIEWKSNNPLDIQIEFEIVGEGDKTIDAELRKLRKFMRKTTRTGEPPDLIYVMGSKQWAVRLVRMEVNPTLWSTSTDEQRAKVQLTLRTIKPED